MKESIYHPEYVKGLFNRMSSSYERVNYITSFGFSLRWRNQFLQHLAPSAEKIEVLDLLTGMGETWGWVKQRFPNATLSALDFSEGMLEKARNKNVKYFNGNIHLLQQDVLNNELPAGHFDIVTCAFGLKTFNAEQVRVLARETRRILKPGGQFSFIEVSKPENFVLRLLYKLHLGHVVPASGRLLLGNPIEYRMLWRYTDQYKDSRKIVEVFRREGLSTIYDSYLGGCASGFHGTK